VTGQVALIMQGVSSLVSVNVAPSSHRKPTVSAHPLTVVVLRQSKKTDSHIACCAHAVSLPCRAAKSLECFFPV
jgi:hypothetical protein